MSPATQKWLRWAAIFGAWTLLGLILSSQSYVVRARAGKPIMVSEALIYGMSMGWLWAAVTPWILWLVNRFKLERPFRLRHVLIHLLASVFLSVSIYVIHDYMIYLFFSAPKGAKPFSFYWAMQSIFSLFDYWLLLYWFILACHHATEYYQRFREKELAAAQLESRLAQAQLTALRTQLNPHFLFNTLHAISTLMFRDVQAANRMISQLSDLLRLSLEMSGSQEVRLKQELDFLERYLEIQKVRFSDRLQVAFNIEPETLDALVPNLVLQPLVENAIQHGIAPRSAAGRLEISASRENGSVRLEVRDNGAGFPVSRALRSREGVGLSNTRARLLHLYGENQRFELWNAPRSGAVATVVIPFRTAEPVLEIVEREEGEVTAGRAARTAEDLADSGAWPAQPRIT